jgi:hypothetical protein
MNSAPTYIMQDQVRHKIPSIMHYNIPHPDRRHTGVLIAYVSVALVIGWQLVLSAFTA